MQPVVHSTYVIEKRFPVPPRRVFAAFAERDEKQKWFAEPEGILEFQMDFREGGRELTRRKTSIESPLKGATLTNETIYLDIVPDQRIVMAYAMLVADKRISASLLTIEFAAAADGTALTFTDQAAFFEGGDGAEMRQNGWRFLLGKLEAALQGR